MTEKSTSPQELEKTNGIPENRAGFSKENLKFLAKNNKPAAILLFAFTAAVLLYTASFLWPRSLAFSFSGQNCIAQPIILPALASSDNKIFESESRPSVSLFGYPIYSQQTCFNPSSAPEPESEHRVYLGAAFIKKRVTLKVGAYPVLANQKTLDAPIPTHKPIKIQLDKIDRVFNYRLKVNKKEVRCNNLENSVVCDIKSLKLRQSKEYKAGLERLFDNTPTETLFSRSIKTVSSVKVLSASVKKAQKIYNKPKEIKLKLNKPAAYVKSAKLIRLKSDTQVELPITTSVKEKTLTIKIDKPLPRSAKLQLQIGLIESTDGALLEKPYILPFETSGGPKVLGINIGTYKISTSSSVAITFDSPLSSGQNLSKYIELYAGNKLVNASLSTSGKTAIINPSKSLPRCTPIKVKVKDGLKNKFGISGGSGWQYDSRTICQVVFSIGTSVQGRGITAYKFGNGSSKIIYVGTTHGNEMSSNYILSSWIDYLERNSVPSHRTIIVIPNLNPDGFIAGSRTNARNVDLNRNFPANDWKKNVTMPDLTYNPGGGGSKPLSEPESKALANYILGQNPRLVVTYHAAAGVVIPNGSGDSNGIAKTYAANSNLNYASNGETDSLFPYDTTGAFEDWLHDKHGIPTLLVELWTTDANEFENNRAAMWAIANL